MNNIIELNDYLKENEYDSVYFTEPDFVTAIIGVDALSHRIIYDYDKMVDYLMAYDNMTEDDAVDFINCNTLASTPYIEENKRPIISIGLV